MKSSFLPKYEANIVRISAQYCAILQGRNPWFIFWFIFWEKRWLHKFILKFTDLLIKKNRENVPLKSGGRFSPAGQSFLWTLSLAFINVGLTTVPQQAQQQCQFPATWQGTWYHSGFPHPLNISTNHISSKGTCLQQSGSMFIMADRYGAPSWYYNLSIMEILVVELSIWGYKESPNSTVLGTLKKPN